MIFKKTIEVRWSDIDANGHVTHTAYGTFATHTRVAWMASVDCNMTKLLELGFAAVLLKEQTEYFREIFLGEKVTIELFFAGATTDNSRWKFVHKIYSANNKLSAINTVYGAWIDTSMRRIAPPPQYLIDRVQNLAKTDDFEHIA